MIENVRLTEFCLMALLQLILLVRTTVWEQRGTSLLFHALFLNRSV